MINLYSIFLVIVLSQIAFSANILRESDDKNQLTVTITVDGERIEKDLIEFIENGKKTMSGLYKEYKDRKKLIMVLGMTGTGKSTLVNYINGIPLVCNKHKDGSFRLYLEKENVTLPGGFSIGHKSTSETLYPAMYGPPNEDYAFVDNPGFQDTRGGVEIEIANGFFRKEVTNEVDELKYLILLTYPDLLLRGQQFRDSIKRFAELLGVFDGRKSKAVAFSKSVAIIVTRVTNNGNSDDRMKKIIKKKLHEILDDEKRAGQLSDTEEAAFNQIIDKDQIEIFSNPISVGKVSTDQALLISELIEDLTYSSKESADIRVRIAPNYIPKLLIYMRNYNQKIETFLEESIETSVSNFYQTTISNLSNIKNLIDFKVKMDQLVSLSSQTIDFEYFQSKLDNTFLTSEKSAKIGMMRNVLSFFTDLLSDQDKKPFTSKKQWLSINLTRKINDFINQFGQKIFGFVKKANEKFIDEIDEALKLKLNEYFAKQIGSFQFSYQLNILEDQLKSFKTNGNRQLSLEQFLAYANILLTQKESEAIIEEKNTFNVLVDLLPKENAEIFKSKRIWVGLTMTNKINDLYRELEIYKKEPEGTFSNGVFTYKGYFGVMSTIMSKINSDANIKDLKSVNIYTTNSLIFDTNYLVANEKYSTNAPDLVVISPRVLAERPVVVDLSCYNHPGYPENASKARNGIGAGAVGSDGKAGLPGHNGGKFVVISDKVTGQQNIKFVSDGGNGGSGQEGGDGTEGVKGKDAIIQDKTCTENGPGGAGGKAGSGGCSGLGGFAGASLTANKALTFSLENTKKTGKNGPNGKHGSPGIGGLYGDVCVRQSKRFIETIGPIIDAIGPIIPIITDLIGGGGNKDPTVIEKDIIFKLVASDQRGPSGSVPTTFNCKERASPVQSTPIDSAIIKYEYISFVNEIMNIYFKNSLLVNGCFLKN